METTQKWTVFETRFEAASQYENPFLDVDMTVAFRSPSGRAVIKEAFWDGQTSWAVRFSPDEIGTWQWRTACSDTDDAGLHDRHGAFQCVPYVGENPLYLHGPVGLSQDRRYFVHADGRPFFWLADTAWNCVLHAQEQDWRNYLQCRRQQGFSAVQFVCTQWRAMDCDATGQTGFNYEQPIRLNPAFFQRLDAKTAAINEYGLLASPVILWTCTEVDPGQRLSQADAERVARYIVARWGAHHVAWLLGGDGSYRAERAEPWKRIGRAVFGEPRDRLVAMHPCGQASFAEEFREETWCDVNTYQSGHGSSHRELSWLVFGPPATDWRTGPPRPTVNLEPNYEMHPDYFTRQFFSNYHVRRASYWSLLVAPTAGVTYGNNPIWCWMEQPGPHPGHLSIDRYGLCPPWREGLRTPGIESISILRKFFDALPWWQLRPTPEILCRQPGFEDPARFIAAARTDDRKLAVLYVPCGGEVDINPAALRPGMQMRWFGPRTGEWTDAPALPEQRLVLKTPDSNDWVLCIHGALAVSS